MQNDDDIFIALPVFDEIPVLLPSQNRMKYEDEQLASSWRGR